MVRGRRSSSSSSRDSSRWRSQSRPASSRPRSQSRGALVRRLPSPGFDDTAAKKEHSGPGVKGSLLFLGTIAAAAFTAHKVWPKGVLYGRKEDWEHDHDEAVAHQRPAKSSRPRERDAPTRENRRRDSHKAPEGDRPRYRDTQQDSVYSPRDSLPKREPTWSEPDSRRRQDPAPSRTDRYTVAPAYNNEFDRHSQPANSPGGNSPLGSPTGSTLSAKKYLPYEPGQYTPSSVASSRLFERERPVPLPLERQRGSYVPPAVPMPPSQRRFYDESDAGRDSGYASRDSYAGSPPPRESVPRSQLF